MSSVVYSTYFSGRVSSSNGKTYLSFKWFIDHPLRSLYHTNCSLLKTNQKKQMALHLSGIKMKGRVPFIEVNLKDLFLSFAQSW